MTRPADPANGTAGRRMYTEIRLVADHDAIANHDAVADHNAIT